MAVKSKGKICPKGKAWAKRTFDVYPSAYANLAASKYCKDPNYAKKSKKRNGKDPDYAKNEKAKGGFVAAVRKKNGGFVSIRGQGAVMKEKTR